MNKRGLSLIFGILLIMPFASSEIYISHLNPVYNLGDELSADVDLISSVPAAEHLLVNMLCLNSTKNIYNQYFSLNSNEEKKIVVATALTGDFFRNLTGNCRLSANYGNNNFLSDSFSISRTIDIDAELEIEKYNPEENATATGIARLRSGSLVEGFVRVDVAPMGISLSEKVANGSFNFGFKIPKNALSGKHTINLRVYELNNNGDVSNEGILSIDFWVVPVLKKLEIITSPENVNPEEEFTYSVKSYDQANNPINEKIGVVIYEPGNLVYLKKLIDSERDYKIKFAINDSQGYWKINASIGEFSAEKSFYLEPVEKVSLKLEESSLIVTNIGNVLFEGPIEVVIGEQSEIKHMKLNVGESKTLHLYAPKGNYTISVDDGTERSVLGTSFLTGNAIRVDDVKYGFSEILPNPLFWAALIILLTLVIVYVIVNRKLKKETMGNSTPVSVPKNLLFAGESNKIAMPIMPISKTPVERKFEQPKIFNSSNGLRENAVVVAVRTGGDAKTSYAVESINNAFGIAKSAGAKIYIDGDYKIILLSQTLTKSMNNEALAVKIAKRIEEIFNEHNKKFKEKIMFGLGVSDGEIISEIINGQFKFTSTGNLISSAKRIAQSANMNILLSESIRRKVGDGVKMEKVMGGDYWRAGGLVDRSQYGDFLQGFMGRNK